jgi:glyoxylate/hydroxypyruvate reductase A
MRILLQMPGREVGAWRAAIAQALPEAEIAVWPEVFGEPDYALVWRPPPELFARVRAPKAIFNLGAGVDALLAVPTLPPDVPVIRLTDAGMAEQMAEYVTLAVLRAYREMDAYAAQQKRVAGSRGRLGKASSPSASWASACSGRRSRLPSRPSAFPCQLEPRPQGDVGVTSFAGSDELPAFRAGKVLICTLPATPETDGILDRAALSQLPQRAHVVNIARGNLVVDADLIALLDAGHLAGATLDVFRAEPLPRAMRSGIIRS